MFPLFKGFFFHKGRIFSGGTDRQFSRYYTKQKIPVPKAPLFTNLLFQLEFVFRLIILMGISSVRLRIYIFVSILLLVNHRENNQKAQSAVKGRVKFSHSCKELYMHFTFMGPVLFFIFVGNMNRGIECLSTPSASLPNYTKLCGLFDLLEGRGAIHRDLHRLENIPNFP